MTQIFLRNTNGGYCSRWTCSHPKQTRLHTLNHFFYYFLPPPPPFILCTSPFKLLSEQSREKKNIVAEEVCTNVKKKPWRCYAACIFKRVERKKNRPRQNHKFSGNKWKNQVFTLFPVFPLFPPCAFVKYWENTKNPAATQNQQLKPTLCNPFPAKDKAARAKQSHQRYQSN